jgi:hypothetical protein
VLLYKYRDSELLKFAVNLAAHIREPFEKFVDWRQCAAVVQREAVTVMLNCGGDNVVVA